MSAVGLPAGEPPAEEVAQVLELVRVARGRRDDAWQLVCLFARQVDDDPGPVERHIARVELEIAEWRHDMWDAEVVRCEARARALGLQP